MDAELKCSIQKKVSTIIGQEEEVIVVFGPDSLILFFYKMGGLGNGLAWWKASSEKLTHPSEWPVSSRAVPSGQKGGRP